MTSALPPEVPNPAGRARQVQQHGERYFRRLLDALPVGASTCDPEGLIMYYNHAAVQLWGRAPALNDPVDRPKG